MHSTLKPHDPFNFSHYLDEHAHTLQIKDFIYLVNLDIFLPDVDSHDNLKNAMTDLCNWTKV